MLAAWSPLIGMALPRLRGFAFFAAFLASAFFAAAAPASSSSYASHSAPFCANSFCGPSPARASAPAAPPARSPPRASSAAPPRSPAERDATEVRLSGKQRDIHLLPFFPPKRAPGARRASPSSAASAVTAAASASMTASAVGSSPVEQGRAEHAPRDPGQGRFHEQQAPAAPLTPPRDPSPPPS